MPLTDAKIGDAERLATVLECPDSEKLILTRANGSDDSEAGSADCHACCVAGQLWLPRNKRADLERSSKRMFVRVTHQQKKKG